MMLFKVSPNENFSVTLLLQACLKVNAKVVVHDLQKAQHVITAEPQSQEDTDELLSLIESFYTIDSIDIDTTEMKNQDERKYAFNFEDEKLNQQFTILADAVAESENKGIAPNGYILSAIQGLHARLKLTTPVIDFEVGDVIDCNYGTNMPYETSGGHIWNLVIAKNEHQAFVIPMFKNTAESQSENSDAICIPIDETMVSFNSIKTDLSATFLALNVGRWISNYRITKVIGKSTDNCFKKVISELPKAFDFTSKEEERIQKCVEPTLERAYAL